VDVPDGRERLEKIFGVGKEVREQHSVIRGQAAFRTVTEPKLVVNPY